MTSKELYDFAADGVVTENLEHIKNKVRDYYRCHCLHPRKVYTFDPYSGQRVLREVPCGKCYHCTETYTNEWVTRLYAHAETFKNVYFVTLTYKSFPQTLSQSDLVQIDYLKDALWHLDPFNEKHSYVYSPCVLVKSHYQNFLKRLRKNTGYDDISYVVCGEYGSKFARPHFHMILFSNHVLRREDISHAWSIPCSKSADGWKLATSRSQHVHRFLIGRIDFDDLRASGDFDTYHPINIDGHSFNNAKNCFTYVCKYLHKDGFKTDRVSLAFNSIVSLLQQNIHLLKSQQNENLYFPFNAEEFVQYYQDFTSKCDVPSRYDFIQVYRPFFGCSRGTAIGSLYFKNHLDQMVAGVFPHSPLQTTSIVTPKYFIRKAQEYICGIRIKTSDTSFSKGNLVLLCEDFSKMATGDTPFNRCSPADYPQTIQSLLDTNKCFKDLSSGERYLIFTDPILGSWVNSYKYNRSAKEYQFIKSYDTKEWCLCYLDKLHADFKRFTKLWHQSLMNVAYFDDFLALLDTAGYSSFDVCADIKFDEEQRIKNYCEDKKSIKPKFE